MKEVGSRRGMPWYKQMKDELSIEYIKTIKKSLYVDRYTTNKLFSKVLNVKVVEIRFIGPVLGL